MSLVRCREMNLSVSIKDASLVETLGGVSEANGT
jgi:hypothetical protein